MFDFNKAHGVPIGRDFVLSRIEESQIFYYYFGPFKLGDVYSSKFRKDKKPSTGFYINRGGRLIYNDLTTGEKLDCFSFVAKLNNTSYSEAIKKVAADFGLIYSDNYKPIPSTILAAGGEVDLEVKKETLIQIVPDVWYDKYLKYWRLFEINQKELVENRVYPIRELYLNKHKIQNKYDELRFAYVENVEDKDAMKIYCPFSKSMKWLTNIPLHIPFGMKDLKYESDTVVITKSKKDMIVLKKFFPDVIATQNESESALSPEVISILTSKFNKRILFWDADDVGKENASKFKHKGFDSVTIPFEDYNKYKIKDAADYVRYFGLGCLEDLLTKELKVL